MEPADYLHQVREKYLSRFRQVVQSLRDKGVDCQLEVWLTPKKQTDDLPSAVCFDILTSTGGKQALNMVHDEPAEGRLMHSFHIRNASVRIFEPAWGAMVVWARMSDPDFSSLQPWKKRWMQTGRDPDDEGFHAEVHHIGDLLVEGGGYVHVIDFGSAPVEALTSLLQTLVDMGATEIELGQSDGSDLSEEILADLRKPNLSLTDVTSIIERGISAAPEVASVRRTADDQLCIFRKGDKDPIVANTTSLHRLLLRGGIEARPREVNRYLRGQRELMGPRLPPDPAQLRPVIKDDRFIEIVSQQSAKMKKFVGHRLVADLWVLCVWDQPNGMRYATEDEPEKFGFTADELMARARQNYLKQPRNVEISEHGPLLVAQTRDCYDPSLLLDDQWLSGISSRVGGELLACVPARHLVLFGPNNPQTIREMRAAATRAEAGGDHLISGTILIRRADKWEKLEPPTPSPAAPRLPASQPAFPPAKKPWWRFW
jgi:hypothetical protein